MRVVEIGVIRLAMISADRLRELLNYDPETGIFYWRVKMGTVPAGRRAGTPQTKTKRPYRSIAIEGRRYYEHRLAWLYMTGRWPDGDVDHINRVCEDNRISNLRECSRSQNLGNAPRRGSKAGLKGVRIRKDGKFWAVCQGDYLGSFTTPEEAHAAYCRAAAEAFGEFARFS